MPHLWGARPGHVEQDEKEEHHEGSQAQPQGDDNGMLVGFQLLLVHRNEVYVVQVILIAGERDRGVGPVGHDCGFDDSVCQRLAPTAGP